MSWKPCRSSGIMFDRFDEKSRKHEQEYFRMINSNDYLHFDKLKQFSMHLYLHWLNENKKHCALVGKRFNPAEPWRTLTEVSRFGFVVPMMQRHKDKIYLPLSKLLSNV